MNTSPSGKGVTFELFLATSDFMSRVASTSPVTYAREMRNGDAKRGSKHFRV